MQGMQHYMQQSCGARSMLSSACSGPYPPSGRLRLYYFGIRIRLSLADGRAHATAPGEMLRGDKVSRPMFQSSSARFRKASDTEAECDSGM